MSGSAPNLQRHLQRAARAISPATLTKHVHTRKIIQNFADTHALVYFGYVNYRTDEHRLVRGMTTATNQEDAHYCIGSYDGYDVVYVRRRSESSTYVSGRPMVRYWQIMQIDLQTNYDIPHVLIGPHPGKNGQYDEITSALHSFQPIQLGMFSPPSQSFVGKYTVYAKPSRNMDVERLLTVELTDNIANHFYPLGIEIWDGCLFVYATQHRPSQQLLDIMIKNGVWLARKIDEQSRQLASEQKQLSA